MALSPGAEPLYLPLQVPQERPLVGRLEAAHAHAQAPAPAQRLRLM